MEPHYCINPAVQLHWAQWDDEYVVFDECSGLTHQMDAARAYVLHSLCEGSRSTAGLHSDLASISPPNDHSQLPALLLSILDEFSRHGLVETMHP